MSTDRLRQGPTTGIPGGGRALASGRGVSDHGLAVWFVNESEQILADVSLGHGVKLLLVRSHGSEDWEVWAVEIDGKVYREPHGVLEGERLWPTKFREELMNAEESFWQYVPAEQR